MKWLILILALFYVSLSAQAASTKNPKAVTFVSPDHTSLTGYEVDIVLASGAVTQTVQAGKGTQDTTTGLVTLQLANFVKPLGFGLYTIKIRAIAGTSKSDDSPLSTQWERAPAQPITLTIQ